MAQKSDNRGWHGDPAGHARAGRMGGKASAKNRNKRGAASSNS